MVDVRDDTSFPIFQLLDRTVFPHGLKFLPALRKHPAYMP
jgi:hypothetical protein